MSTNKPAPTELDLSAVHWVVSTYSGGGGDCVRIGVQDGIVLVGDSKNPERLPLVLTPSEAAAFLHGVKEGEFDFFLDL
ncbi:DUF397 domain-containing protein (plasmid) [Streptomyces sp. NBC_01281]|uniref:DUF397 domain-containing protein n=1 Tax=Streptomyces sp. NBC_01281 TaxID=2903811 RepID=UPI002E0EAC1D|nr:DUF397 domain-containing protein [Streptomyces sp. NBC_01281]